MKRFSEQFHKKAQTVKLKKLSRLICVIVSFTWNIIRCHGNARKSSAARKESCRVVAPVLREPFATYTSHSINCLNLVESLLRSIVVVPFVAERAVPGDTLYAVKVNITEEVQHAHLGSIPASRVGTVRLNRRIAEAKLLQREGL